MALRARPGRWLAVLLAACFALPATAFGAEPSRVPDNDATALAHQRAVARSLKLDAIWAGARNERREARERAELLRRARRGDRSAKRGLRVRRDEGDGSPLVVDPPAAPLTPARAAAAASINALTNARCNDPSGDIAAAAQSETAVAAIGPHVVTAWNDGQGFAVTNGDVIGFGWSGDGGATFTDGGAPPHPAAWPGFYWTSDPVLTANEKTGDFYLCGLANPDPTHNAIAVARGRFTGNAFAFDSVWIVRNASSSTLALDKPWVACDSSTGRVYVVHTVFGALDSIDVQSSADGGRTWSAPLVLSSATDAGYVQGARVAVGPNGEVATAWYAVDQVTDADDLRFRRSLDRGATFSSELTMKFDSQFGTGSPGFNRERGVNFPSLAIDRSTGTHRGRTYLAWAESWNFLATVLPPTGATNKSEVEPDDAAANATPFTPGQTLRGVLTPAGATADQDWFACTLSAGQNLVVYADSVTLSRWYVRLIAPDGAQRLCFAGNPSGGSSNAAYFAFTAPVSGTYYLRVLEVSAVSLAYRIRTALGTRGSERGRDQRDAFVAWTDDGASWSTPVRVNDDATGYDDWLPEVAAGADGCIYATWFDHRDDPYGSRTKIYAARSTDGGATWAAAQPVASAQGNFTTSGTNIAPNTGDYMALASSGAALLPAWGDGRDVASVDVWSAAIATGATIASSPNDTTMSAPGSATFGWTLTSANPLFSGSYGVTVTSQRAWPMPAPANVTLGTGSGTYPNGGPSAMSFAADVSVPDSAAGGPNRITLTLSSPGGVVLARSSFTISVAASALAVPPSGAALALAPPSPNPAFASARIGYALPRAGHARLVLYDLAGARVRTLLDGAAAAGPASATWDGRDDRGHTVRTGAYFVRLECDGAALTRRLVWMR
jgi:hypothetical protein